MRMQHVWLEAATERNQSHHAAGSFQRIPEILRQEFMMRTALFEKTLVVSAHACIANGVTVDRLKASQVDRNMDVAAAVAVIDEVKYPQD